jgi:hypothetical protein
MNRERKLSRRSFLARVVGAGASASLLLPAPGRAQPEIIDGDSGSLADPPGRGRGRGGHPTGLTDSDSGNLADPAGSGRGRGYCEGTTDSDSGPDADPAGRGRRPPSGWRSGVTDSDSGTAADPAGNGRGRMPRCP